VRGFVKQFAERAFAPEVVSILEDAFDDAWRRVEASKGSYISDEYAPAGSPTNIAKLPDLLKQR
jgi:hypothetical protein